MTEYETPKEYPVRYFIDGEWYEVNSKEQLLALLEENGIDTTNINIQL